MCAMATMYGGENMMGGDSGDAAKIFVGGLDWNTTADEMKNYFEGFGTVIECSIKADHHTGRSRGFGFVTFADPAVVDMVLGTRYHILNGKVVDPKRVKYKATLESLKKIFVGGLDATMTEEMIREYFSKFGIIDELDLPYDRSTNERRRFCFIRFTSNEPVDRLCAVATKHSINGKMVEVKKALNKAELAAVTPPYGAAGSFAPMAHGFNRGNFGAATDNSWALPSGYDMPSGNGFTGNPFSGGYGASGGNYYGGRQPAAPSSSYLSYGGSGLSTGGGYRAPAAAAEMSYNVPSYLGGLPGRDRGAMQFAGSPATQGITTFRPTAGRGRGATTANIRYQPYSL